MDVEKTIQFLVDNAAQHDARLATLENSLITVASVVKTLAEAQAEFRRDTQAAMEQMRKEIRELDAESRARDAALDERISKLVSAIAALVNGRSGHPPAQA